MTSILLARPKEAQGDLSLSDLEVRFRSKMSFRGPWSFSNLNLVDHFPPASKLKELTNF